MTKTVRVYCCGGTACNIGQELAKSIHTPESRQGFANLNIAYVDTSLSNLPEDSDKLDTYIFKDLDGSGKVRATNADVVSESILDVLQRFPAEDFNIVLSSAAGGSGSVLSVALTRAILAKGKHVIVFQVGSLSTHIEASNTFKTIKSLEAVSRLTERPVILYYAENQPGIMRSEVDQAIVGAIVDISALLSGENAELDTADLHHWLDYQQSTSVKPCLTALTIKQGDKLDIAEIGNTFSVAILTQGDEVHYPGYTEYRCTGIAKGSVGQHIEENGPVFYVLSDAPIARLVQYLGSHNDKLEEQRGSRVVKTNVLDGKEQIREDGLIL